MPSETLTRALEMLAAGDPPGAEALLQQAVTDTATPEAYNELGMFLMQAGRLTRAADAFEQASLKGEDPGRLIYGLNHGICLFRLQQFSPALRVLKQNAEGRKAHFGPLHPEHAFALLSLSQVLLEMGEYDDAWGMCFIASTILASCGHPRITDAIVIGAELMARRGNTENLIPEKLLASMPAPLCARVAHDLVVRARQCRESVLWSLILREAVNALSTPLADRPEHLVPLLATLGEMQAGAGESEASVETLERVLPHLDGEAQVRLLLTAAEAGGNETLFLQAAKIARQLSRNDLLAQAQFDLGRWLEAQKRYEEAVPQFESAIEMSSDAVLGAALAALGLLHSHHGEAEAARPLLEEALQHLASDSPQAVTLTQHLAGVCHCDDPAHAVEASLQAFLRQRLPEDLGQVQIDVVREDTRYKVHARATHQLSEEQALRLGRVLDHANAQFWAQIQPDA